MSNEKEVNHQGLAPDDISELNLDYSDLIRDRAFIGDTPFDTIIDGIRKQFEDYINIKDDTNYVDLFYTQLYLSHDRVENDDSENFPTEIKDILDNIHQRFLDTMRDLLFTRLTISIADLESEGSDPEDIEFIIRRLYEFFILGARMNFKIVISKDILDHPDLDPTDEDYLGKIQGYMADYSPLILNITPMQFIQYRGDKEIYDLFDNCKVVGNFLRKYSPKLYQNEDLHDEIINHITMINNI